MASKHYAVLGDPIAHSLSPDIYNALFAYYGIDADYTRIQVPAGGLSGLDALVSEYRLSGFNLTHPHKRAILPLLSSVAKEARRCDSVNTVLVTEDGYSGWSTDAAGFARALGDAGIQYSGRDVLFLGAGGAARTLIPDAAYRGARSITVMARDREKARDSAKLAGTACPYSFGGFSPDELEGAASRCSLLINATPLGMAGIPEQFESYSFLSCLRPDVPVCDLIYMPTTTELLRRAQKKGHPVLGGLSMLIWQGILAFERFTGVKADAEAVAVVQNVLEAAVRR